MMEYGCIGEKLSHSFSVSVHNRIADYSYKLCELSETELQKFLAEKNFKGINVTIPYKQTVIPFLQHCSPIAEKTGSVNTVVNKNGSLFGYNTDFSGLSDMISENGIVIYGKKVLVLGSGGTSKTAGAVSEHFGAKKTVTVSRTKKENCITYDEAFEKHFDTDVIINTTPCGMFPEFMESLIDIDRFSQLSAVIDAVYNPINTTLVLKAKEKGIKAVGGLYMLVSQAVSSAGLFSGIEISGKKKQEVYKSILKEKTNLVFTGMPGCGKTTVGKMLAEKNNMPFFDTDEQFFRIYGLSSGEYIEKYGECDFRLKETEIVKSLSRFQGCVIATGGGTVTAKENIINLKQNGKLIFLDRGIDLLEIGKGRPLSKNREALNKLYRKRYSTYLSTADVTVPADGTPEETLLAVIKETENEAFYN